jgi:pre-mRNA-splicing helicase BRR2
MSVLWLCRLLSIKRLTLQKEASVQLSFVVADAQDYEFKLFLMCDAYLGCDQEYDFTATVQQGSDMEE